MSIIIVGYKLINDPSILVPNIVYIAYSILITLPFVPSGIISGTYCNVKNDKPVNSFPDTAAPVCIGKSNWFDSLCFYLQNSFNFFILPFSACSSSFSACSSSFPLLICPPFCCSMPAIVLFVLLHHVILCSASRGVRGRCRTALFLLCFVSQ